MLGIMTKTLPADSHTDIFNHPFDGDHLHEECGIFGIYDSPDASAHCALGLHALQHRGQEGAGIITFDGERYHQHLAFGKVGDNFNTPDVINNLQGNYAIGHNRYSTSGTKKNIHDIQPIFAETSHGGIALAHNGNLTNASTLRKELVKEGSIFRTTMDSEVILHLIATNNTTDLVTCIKNILQKIEGGYSLLLLHNDCLIGVRDPLGIRPLCLGKTDGSYILTSETCALDITGADYIRDIEPGEMVIIKDDAITSLRPFPPTKPRFCIFEYIYFSRPDSFIEGRHVYPIRKKMGSELAQESPADADVVVPVPDSGVAAAIGYSESSGIPFELGIIRNHYVGRTFIEPTDHIRHLGVKLKHNANRSVIEGKRVILVDDSIVRGTTSRKIVDMVRAAGAKEVHLRISSPPTTDSCFYGVDTPAKEQLLASKMRIEEMAEFIGCDSLAFISVDALYRAVGEDGRNQESPQFCDACFTGDYPITVLDQTPIKPLIE